MNDTKTDGVTACPNAAYMGEHACKDKSQCWEPCGELGNSAEHVRVGWESVQTLRWVKRCRHPVACISPKCGDFCHDAEPSIPNVKDA